MDVGETLLRRGLIDSRQLELARGAQTDGLRLDQAAVQLGFVTEEVALRALAEELGLEFVDLVETEVDLSLLKDFPLRFIHRESLFPIRRENGTLVVATSDPFNLYPLDELSVATGLTVIPVLASREEIVKRIKTHLGVGSETIDGLLAQTGEDCIDLGEGAEADAELSEQAQEPSVVRLVNEILLEAIELRASDVHIESQQSGLRVRYRVDGVLHTQPMPPEIHRFRAAIVSRLKIMSRLNIAEHRLPQDGRIQLRTGGREVDIRVSVIPMIHGEGLVLRLLDKGAMEFKLGKLGMEDDLYAIFRQLIELPHGIILVTGPTGSGKSTTLYSALLEIKSEETKIITTEDPVEYQLEGINQIQVHTKIGLGFGNTLRSILRHDPDIILVGEIRDLETAENAIQASLTGHLVFSTLHTNDAAGAYTRLIDMGLEPFLVSSTVEAVMAQRLVRTLCPHCKQAFCPRPEDLPADFPRESLAPGTTLHRPVGCRECRQVGYRGRVGLFELLVTTEEIRQLSHQRVSSWSIQQAAVRQGMRTLREDGWRKVLDGRTSVDEVLRVTRGKVEGIVRMPEFRYVARDQAGGQLTGTLSAANRREALAMLAGQAVFPLRIDDAAPVVEHQRVRRVPAALLAATYSQLADLMHSGVPLLRSLSVIEKQTSQPGLKAILGEIHRRVEDGGTLADAMSRFQNVLGEMAVSMVRAGGEGGFLEEALSRVAQFTETQDDLKKRTLGAVAYPAFLAVVGTIIVIVLVVFFVPKFSELFDKLRERGELPLVTEWLLALSAWMRHWGLMLLALLAGGVWWARRWLHSDAGRWWKDRVVIRLPLAGPIFLGLAVARFCRVLGTLLHNGVPIIRSLQISRDATGNRVLAAAIGEATENISAGQPLAGPLAASGQFPPVVVEMIAVAEQANNLETVLLSVADSLERTTWRRLDLSVRLIEPIMLLLLAGVILVLVIALLLPVLKMSTTV